MASIRKEMTLAARPDTVWAAVRDVGAIHTRLAKGFVTDVKMIHSRSTMPLANVTMRASGSSMSTMMRAVWCGRPSRDG